jgi:ribosomal protein S27AE
MFCDVCAGGGKLSGMRAYVFSGNHPDIYMCVSDGCERRFDRRDGYYSMRDGQMADQSLTSCPDCGTARLLVAHSAHSGQRWLCRCELYSGEDESFQSLSS